MTGFNNFLNFIFADPSRVFGLMAVAFAAYVGLYFFVKVSFKWTYTFTTRHFPLLINNNKADSVETLEGKFVVGEEGVIQIVLNPVGFHYYVRPTAMIYYKDNTYKFVEDITYIVKDRRVHGPIKTIKRYNADE